MKKIQKLLLLLLMMAMLLPTFAMAETPVIVNLVENPDAEYHFEDGAKILEIVFPRVYSSDCILLRYDGMVMMIDASTKNATMRNRIYTACDTLGIDHIDIAYNSHPHDDHIDGFQFVNEYAPISKFLITFPEDFNARMKSAVKFMKANNIPIEQIGNVDTFTQGEDGGVKMTVQIAQTVLLRFFGKREALHPCGCNGVAECLFAFCGHDEPSGLELCNSIIAEKKCGMQ